LPRTPEGREARHRLMRGILFLRQKVEAGAGHKEQEEFEGE